MGQQIGLAGLTVAVYSGLHTVALLRGPEWSPLEDATGVFMLHLGILGLLLWLFRHNPVVPRLFIAGRGSWRRLTVVFPLILFSLGSFRATEVAWGLTVPEFAEWLRQLEAGIGDYEGRWPLARTVDAVTSALLGPVVEEFLFRGLMLAALVRRYGYRTGVLATATAFGLLHFDDPLGAFLFGWVAAVVALETGSLMLPIALHGLNNALALCLQWFAERPETPDWLTSSWPKPGLALIFISTALWWLWIHYRGDISLPSQSSGAEEAFPTL